MNDNSNNVHFSGITFICSPYLAIKSAFASLGPIMSLQMNLNALKMNIKPGFHLDFFLPFVVRFGFAYQQTAKTSNANFKQKSKTSNQRHLLVLVFEMN